jgi:hypothetical protein
MSIPYNIKTVQGRHSFSSSSLIFIFTLQGQGREAEEAAEGGQDPGGARTASILRGPEPEVRKIHQTISYITHNYSRMYRDTHVANTYI